MKLIQQGFSIIPAKDISKADLKAFDLVVVDECQRIYEKDFETVIEGVTEGGGACLFSHDARQTLMDSEAKREIPRRIDEITGVMKFKLTDKVRSNAGIANFIRMLIDKSRSLEIPDRDSISVQYFSDIKTANSYIDSLDGGPWRLLRLTPSQYNTDSHEGYYKTHGTSSHQVIGQEFDDVAVVIDPHFTYDHKGRLTYSGRSYYDPFGMLFQNMTRARRKLNLVLVGNEAIFRRCLDILDPHRAP